ncbi:Zn-dependent oligopeptidase [bacterium]|nr:Zn-dependent oligopeptidase [bacterium]
MYSLLIKLRLWMLFLVVVVVSACSDAGVKSLPISLSDSGSDSIELNQDVLNSKEEQLKIDKKTADFNARYVDLENAIEGALPFFPLSASVLNTRLEGALALAGERIAEIVSRENSELTFVNTMKALDEVFFIVNEQYGLIELLAETSSIEEVKAAARKASQKLQVWFVDFNSRKDVYEKLKALRDKDLGLNVADAKLLADTIQEFESQGFHLPEETQLQAQELKKKLAGLTSHFDEGLAESNKTVVTLTRDELGDISEVGLEQLASRKNADGNYDIRVAIYSSDVLPVLEYVPVEATRKKIYVARDNRAESQNSKVVEEILQTRIRLAKLLGEKSWAHYAMKGKMAESPEIALPFVEGLAHRLKPKLDQELEALAKLKSEETGHGNAVINVWDVSYFERIRIESEFNFDLNTLKPYFEYNHVFGAMVEHYQELFDLKISKVQNVPYVWEGKVELYELHDKTSNNFLGFLYLDMFPRPETEKYGHFAMFPVRSGIKFANGVYRRPVASLVCNFPEGADGNPALLSLDNVETLFHEFGHAIHHLLSQAEHTSQAGTNVPWDFVEAPSQFLEYFVTDSRAIKKIAKHVDDGSTISDETLEKLRASKLANIGRTYARQMQFAVGDLRLHSLLQDENVSFEEINKLYSDTASEVYIPTGFDSKQLTNFAHIMSGGYHAGYYGYSWSDVIAADLASKFEESADGFYDKQLGLKYRAEILEAGASRPILESIEAFLGRTFNDDAFLRKLGLGL